MMPEERYFLVFDGRDQHVLAYLVKNRKPFTLIYTSGGAFASGEKVTPKKK